MRFLAISHLAVSFSLAVLASLTVQAQSITSDAEVEAIEYKTPEGEPRAPEDADLVADFSKRGFVDVTPAFDPLTTGFRIAHVFASPDLGKFVALRYDFQLKQSSLQGRYLHLADGRTLFHTVNREHRPVAVIASGLTQLELNSIALAISRSRKSTGSSAWIRLLIPRAHAAELGGSACGAGSTTVNVVNGKLSHAGALVLRAGITCAASFRAALAESVVGNAWKFLTGRWSLGVVKMFEGLNRVIQDGLAAVVKVFNEGVNFAINADVLTAVFCYALTTAGIDFATGFMTGGATLPLLVWKAVQKIEKVARWIKKASEYRTIRNIRYLSSTLKGEKPVAHLREGDLLTRLSVDDGRGSHLASVRANIQKAERADGMLAKSITNGTCIAASMEAPGAVLRDLKSGALHPDTQSVR